MPEHREDVIERLLGLLRWTYQDARALQDGLADASAATRVREHVGTAILTLEQMLPPRASGVAAERRRQAFRAVRRALGTDAAVARAFSVTRYRVGRWKRGVATHEEAELLERAARVLDGITPRPDPAHLETWLTTELEPLRGDTPLAALRSGRSEEVLRLLAAEGGLGPFGTRRGPRTAHRESDHESRE